MLNFTLNDYFCALKSNLQPPLIIRVISRVMGKSRSDKYFKEERETARRIGHYLAIISSMNAEERQLPSKIDESRISRIAKGSGTSNRMVRNCLKDFRGLQELMQKYGELRRNKKR